MSGGLPYDVSVFKKLADMFEPRQHTYRDAVEYVMGRVKDSVVHQAFLDVLIKGGQGTGKSSLALYMMYLHYQDVNEVLKNVFFDVEELDYVLLNERREVILFDDAGVTLNKWRSMKEESIDHYRFLQIPRTRVSVILYTCVGNSVAKFVRDTADIVISFYSRHGYKVRGALYSVKEKYKTVVNKLFDFEMDLQELHNDRGFHNLYVEYNRRREEFIQSVMKDLLEKSKKKLEEEEAEKFELKIQAARRKNKDAFISKIEEMMKN
ncbi:MAG: hypothetical protein QW196_07095 [Sulfolobales archaeon]